MVEGKGGSDRAGVYRPPGYGFSIRTMPWRQSVGRDQRDMGKGHRPTSGIAAGVAESLKLFDIGRIDPGFAAEDAPGCRFKVFVFLRVDIAADQGPGSLEWVRSTFHQERMQDAGPQCQDHHVNRHQRSLEPFGDRRLWV